MVKKLKKSPISVIIRCKNEERWIGHVIQSVLDKIYKPEILIIDNKSTDETLAIVRSFVQDSSLSIKVSSSEGKYTDIKILNLDNYTPGKALNLGIKHASRKYIMIISAHCVLNKITIQDQLKNLDEYIAVFGKQIPFYYGKRISKRYIWSHFLEKKKVNMYSALENRYFFHNAISLFKKSTLKKYPFPEILVGKEDRYWINQQVKNKKNFLYDPNIEVSHHYTSNGNTWKGIG
jgi:rhamnosyltransferase